MNTFGKTIRLFLLEGNTNSLITAELSNWTGIGIKVPKIRIKEYGSRAEFQRPGVYILFGKNDNNEDAAYIGEAEVIYERLASHIANKEFWNEVIFFGSKDKYLNKASVKYLEHRLHEMAKSVGRYETDQNIPAKPELSEAEQAELEEFLSNMLTLTATLGHKIFEPLEQTLDKRNNEQMVFYCRNSSGLLATGSPSTEGFIVFKGSLFAAQDQQSLTEVLKLEKAKMISEGLLLPEGDKLKLQKHYTFSSSSRAAALIFGRGASGPESWKTEMGIPLRNFENN